MTTTLVPIFVCVVLPVAIVAIVFAAAMNNDNKRAKVLIKQSNLTAESMPISWPRLFKSPRKPPVKFLIFDYCAAASSLSSV